VVISFTRIKYLCYKHKTKNRMQSKSVSNVSDCCLIPREQSLHKMKEIYFNSVGIVLDYGLDNWDSRVQFLVGAGNFSLHHCFHNGSGAHTASYPMGTRDSFPGDKLARA
jgi:hypothetical protein